MVMQSVPIASTAIARLARDDETGEVQVTFTDGTSYIIEGMEEIEFARWSGAASVGGYFNSYVRGNY